MSERHATAMIERKFCPPEAALVLENNSRVSGYASLFGVVDQGGDMVRPGAFNRSLDRLRAQERQVKMLWQHDPAAPIGVWDEVREDGRGLWVSGRLLPEVTRGREAAALIEAGAIDGLSVGYRTMRAEKSGDGARHLLELELWEVSLVTFPMLAEARLSATKQAPGMERALQELARGIREAGRAMALSVEGQIFHIAQDSA